MEVKMTVNRQHQLYRAVEQSIACAQPLRSAHFLLAVSGGVDSMALLTILKQLSSDCGFRLTAVHLDHMYRGDAALADAHLVKDYCRQLKVDCHCYRRPIARLAAARKAGFEVTARRLRYQLFRALKLAIGADYIVTAHHCDDLAESVLLHLLRGSGLDGLVGIRPRDGDLLRPLLAVDKATILEFSEAFAVPYNEDLSNRDETFLRNKIRNQLMPLLIGDYNRAIVAQLAQLAEIARLESDYLATDTGLFFEQVVRQTATTNIDRAAYCAAPAARRRRLIRHLYQLLLGTTRNLTYRHIEILDDWLLMGAINSRQQLLGLNFFIDRKSVVLTLGEVDAGNRLAVSLQRGDNALVDYELNIFIGDYAPDRERAALAVLALPASMSGCELVVRSRQPGDFMRPKGLNGSKKTLKKLFNEQGVAIAERGRIALLTSGSEVLWGASLRPSIHCRRQPLSAAACYIYIADGQF